MTYYPFRRLLKRIVLAIAAIILIYGAGRLYYAVTDGFTQENILSDLTPDVRWRSPALSNEQQSAIQTILNQPFHYLGKGCQSYVFASEDGKYVLKFFKYHRYRTKPWVNALAFLPPVEAYRRDRQEHKDKKLSNLFSSWMTAFKFLPEATGLIYVHLNKGEGWDQEVVLYDKIGGKHLINLNQLEFLVQKRAVMLADTLEMMLNAQTGNLAKDQIASLFALIRSDYASGFVDEDHALLQNTGVLEGKPIHIDVGQIGRKAEAKEVAIYRQHLFNKMYKFREWLHERDPQLALYTTALLFEQVGPEIWTMEPHFMH